MKNLSVAQRALLVGLTLVAAGLACSAPSAQGGVTPSVEVAQAPAGDAATATPYVVTATPDAAAAPPQQPPADSSGGTTGGSTGGTTGGGAPCDYDSVYVADLTIPDGSEIQTGAPFVKTWRVKNNGCPEWPDGTTLIFVSGDQMGGPSSVAVPKTAVGGTQDISLNLTAPGSAGDYVGKWQLRTPDGIQFGDVISVKIKATAPAPGPTSTFHLVIPPGGFKLLPTATPTLHLMVPLLPLLTANFTASYEGAKASCAGPGTDYWVKVKNTGGLTLESSYVKFEAPPGAQKDDGSSNKPFRGSKSCGGGQEDLVADNTAFLVGGSVGPAIPSGTNAKITIKLCGLDDLGGVCATKTVSFTID